MPQLEQPGKYRCKVIGGKAIEKNEKVQAIFDLFPIQEYNPNEQDGWVNIYHYGYSFKTFPFLTNNDGSINQINYTAAINLGWDGIPSHLEDVDFSDCVVEVDVWFEEYHGKNQLKCSALKPWNSAGGLTKSTPAELRLLDTKYGALFRTAAPKEVVKPLPFSMSASEGIDTGHTTAAQPAPQVGAPANARAPQAAAPANARAPQAPAPAAQGPPAPPAPAAPPATADWRAQIQRPQEAGDFRIGDADDTALKHSLEHYVFRRSEITNETEKEICADVCSYVHSDGNEYHFSSVDQMFGAPKDSAQDVGYRELMRGFCEDLVRNDRAFWILDPKNIPF